MTSTSSSSSAATTTAQVTYSTRSSSLRREEEEANVISVIKDEMVDPLNPLPHPLHPLHPLHQLHHRAPNYEDGVALMTGIKAAVPTPPSPLPASSSLGTATSKTVICVSAAGNAGSVDSSRPPATPVRGTPLSPSGTPLGSNSLSGTPILTPKINHTSTPIPTPMSTPKLGE